MALIVETGAGYANAESYCSVADADTYHANRGNTLWATMSETEKEWSLRRATDYLESMYGSRLGGYRTTDEQALSWPRYEARRRNGFTGDFWPSNAVPADVVKACAEAAFRAAQGDLAPDVGRQKSRVKVGPIETEYVSGSSPLTKYTAVDRLMAQFLTSDSSMISVVRA